MTTPVHRDIGERGSSMSFVLPSAFAETTLPKPNDQSITISQTATEYLAAITFGGFASDNDILKYAKKLKQSLKAKGIDTVGLIRFLGYNPPFQLVNRRNEIIIYVNWTDKL
jgi:hypothetical protein